MVDLDLVWAPKFGPTRVRVTDSLDQSSMSPGVDMPATRADSDWSTS